MKPRKSKMVRIILVLILGVLCLTACVSVAISSDKSEAESEIDGAEIDREINIDLGESDK